MTTPNEVAVGRVDDFPWDKFHIVEVGRRKLGILRRSRDRWHAVMNLCPHRGGPICLGTIGGTMVPSEPGEFVFDLEGDVLRCPWHRWEFDLDSGETLFGISGRRLQTFPVTVRDGTVYVRDV